MQDEATVLAAGGLLPGDAKPKVDEPIDAVGARAYRHAALPGRVVVRLSPENLAQADDLEMEVLGFETPEDRGRVGQQRRRALGFPGRALVHDPKNARYALDVVKDLKKAARKARSKPGHAKEMIDPIGEQLGRSVPHFLPSFYEEVGRAFIEVDAHKFGAQYFEKAREAERVHALPVDEDVRRDAFLEFALAGAVSIKSLSAYVKDLEKTGNPEEAYRQFRTLCVKRTLGGMPPWGSMGKELARLAKNAKLDAQKEQRAFLEEVIESPSLAKAAAEFWKSYEKALVGLCEESPKIRGVLLNLLPEPSPSSAGFHERWLELLETTGALEAVWNADAPAEAQPAAGAAGWIARMHSHVTHGYRAAPVPTKMFEVLEKAAPRIRSEQKPVAFAGSWSDRAIHVDLSERALELGLSLADPTPHSGVDLGSWAAEASLPQRGRDPVRLAQDPRFARLFDAALDQAVGTEPFETVARGKKGLAAARRGWLARAIERASAGGLPSLEEELARLGTRTTPRTFVEFPEQYEALRTIDTARALARTLRTGVFDELTWPALDEAIADLGAGDAKKSIGLYGCMPYLCVTDHVRVIVIGPRGRALEHDLRREKGKHLQAMRYAQGQLFVVLRDDRYQWSAYWSGEPAEEFALETNWGFQPLGGWGVELADGSITEGGRALHAGDRSLPETSRIVHDGTTFWQYEHVSYEFRLREYDPRTGEKGRFSLPAFFEGWSRDGMKLDVNGSWLVVLPNGLDTSPFGQKDGIVGARVRLRDHTSPHASNVPNREMETVDGLSREDDMSQQMLNAFLHLPGGEPRSIVTHYFWADGHHQTGYALIDPETEAIGSSGASTQNAAPLIRLTPVFWHYFVPRDEQGSLALRETTDETARALIDTHGTVLDDAARDRVRDALSKTLPALSDAELRAGVARAASVAARLSVRLEEMKKLLDPATVADEPGAGAPAVALQAAIDALQPILGRAWGRGEQSFTAPIADAARFFGRAERKPGDSAKIDWHNLDWTQLIGRAGALAFLAINPAVPKDRRETLLAILETWAGTVFTEHPERFRHLGIRTEKQLPAHAFERSGNDWLARAGWAHGAQKPYTVLQYAPTGRFELLDGAMVDSETPCARGWETTERIRSLVSLARERGAWEWDTKAVSILATETGLTEPEAALLLAGLPNVDDYQSNFLPKDTRAMLGLKTTEAGAARDGLRGVQVTERAGLFAAAMPDDVAAAFDPGELARRLATAWVQKHGKRVPIPAELLVRADRELATPLKAADVLAGIADPDACARLAVDAEWGIDENGQLEAKSGADGFEGNTVVSFTQCIPWLHLTLTVGDPILARVPRAVELLRERMQKPSLLLLLTSLSFYDADWETKRDGFLASFGGTEIAQGVRDEGRFVVSARDRWARVWFRPSRLETESDWEHAEKIRKAGWSDAAFGTAWLVARGGLEAIAERVRSTPVPEGQYEACPLHSVPDLVKRVGAKHDLSEDASVLYLQTLALLAPTKKLVATWNGWTAARYGKAAKELVKRDLLLEAKRERAQRAHFLPGAWEALASPLMPFETWKMPLYEIVRDEHEQLAAPLPRHVPLRPLHAIFEAAWERVESGDVPRYEEVRR